MVARGRALAVGYTPGADPRRVLLCNPPVYDTRFPWSQWQQPVALFQLATLLRRFRCDLRLVDALELHPGAKLTRRRMRILTRGGIPINYWRYGRSPSELRAQLEGLKRGGWQPDDVYLEGAAAFRWEGVAEAIALVRSVFPQACVILFGAYPSLAADHASMHSGADVLVPGSIEGLAGLPLDLSLCTPRPGFSFLAIGTPARTCGDLVEEFLSKAGHGKASIRQFAFADSGAFNRFPEQVRAVLQAGIGLKPGVRFYALGNISARDLVDDPALPDLLWRAGCKQLVFADDRDVPLAAGTRDELLEWYRIAAEHCLRAGYRARTDALVAALCLGRPGEQLAERVGFMVRLAHVVGSVIVFPYQPAPSECDPQVPLEYQNGKLFPFAEESADGGRSYRDYQDALGLASMLNAKSRSRTVDFLGGGRVPRLVQASLARESWDPRNAPGWQQDRPVTAGWFNKEGKWVRP